MFARHVLRNSPRKCRPGQLPRSGAYACNHSNDGSGTGAVERLACTVRFEDVERVGGRVFPQLDTIVAANVAA
jgi:hypothetical protein